MRVDKEVTVEHTLTVEVKDLMDGNAWQDVADMVRHYAEHDEIIHRIVMPDVQEFLGIPVEYN